MDFSKLKKRAEALELLQENWKPSPVLGTVKVEDGAGYVLAEDQYALHSQPVFRASGMDGIAVAFSRFEAGMPDTSGWQEGNEYVRADTGDDFDDAYDTVIPIEWVTFPQEGGIRINEDNPVSKGMNVRGKGSSVKKGALLTEKGTLLTGRHLAILISGGITEIPVIQKPKVAFIPTGSELVVAGTPLSRGENIDSNSILAKTMLEEMGAEPVCYPIVKDKKEQLETALDKALGECDMVIINAGSSKGKEDFNTRLLQEKGKLLCHGVAAVPGRPMGVAVIGGKAVINLAGPPMAAFYGLDWMIRRLVCRWLDIPMPKRRTAEVTLGKDLHTPPPLEAMVFLELKEENGVCTAYPYSRDETDRRLPAMTGNALFVTKLGETGYEKGEKITVELL